MVPIQFITHQTPRYSYEESALLALKGGCKWIQLRMKGVDDDFIEPIAKRIQTACKNYGATFIIDDRVKLAQKLNADGVHLGKDDMPINEARCFLGEGFIIGGTANTFQEIKHCVLSGADYIGCGPFRFTTTKEKLDPIIGFSGYKEYIRLMKKENIHIPICAIGGITRQDIPVLLQIGVDGIALSSSILQAADPISEMQAIINLE